MIARSTALLIVSALTLALAACGPALTATPTPEPPTVTPPPTATAEPPTPTVPVTATTPVSPAATKIIAQQKGQPMAIISLTPLQPDHRYRLMVTSDAGAVTFSGTWSQSALGKDGLPGATTGLLEGTTPASFDIVPPVKSVAKDWAYSAQASNTKGGSITLTLVDLTP